MQGLTERLAEHRIEAAVVGLPPWFDAVFARGPIEDYRDVRRGDGAAHERLNALLLERGVLKGKSRAGTRSPPRIPTGMSPIPSTRGPRLWPRCHRSVAARKFLDLGDRVYGAELPFDQEAITWTRSSSLRQSPGRFIRPA